MRLAALVAAVFCLAPAVALAQQGPSFDCGKAATAVEHEICDGWNLAQQDQWLADLYSALRKELPSAQADQLKSEQKAWIKARNSSCENPEVTGDETLEGERWNCLTLLYRQRLVELANRQEQLTFGTAPGEGLSGYFAYEIEGSWGDLLLLQMPNKQVAFAISTVSGPTYHTCDLGGADAKRSADLVLWQSPDEPACKVTFSLDDSNQITVSSVDCSYYCGARGFFDTTYTRAN